MKDCGCCGITEGTTVKETGKGLFWSRIFGLVCHRCRTCTECGKQANALARPNKQYPLSKETFAEYPICVSCFSQGWTTDPEEIRQGILNDPELHGKIEHKSPIQPDNIL